MSVPLDRPTHRVGLSVKVLFLCCLLATILMNACSRETITTRATLASDNTLSRNAVGCVGRIVPEDGTYFVSPHVIGATPPIVESVKVKAGAEVVSGQVLATLSSRVDLEGAVRMAQAELALAHARSLRVRATSSREEVVVANEEIVRLRTEKDTAVTEYERDRPLYEKDFISRKQIEAEQTRIRELESMLAQALAKAQMIAAARPEDLKVAEAQEELARTELSRAQLDLSKSTVRAVSRARVLQVFAHAGETVGSRGIAELANTDRMVIMAEVYEADITRVHVGERATITSDLYSVPLPGSVTYISPQIEGQGKDLLEAGSPIDARVFQVKITVNNTASLQDKINGKVKVVIEP